MTMAENLEGRESAKDNCLGRKEVNRHLFEKFLSSHLRKSQKIENLYRSPFQGMGKV
jgi:hypothetical protein